MYPANVGNEVIPIEDVIVKLGSEKRCSEYKPINVERYLLVSAIIMMMI